MKIKDEWVEAAKDAVFGPWRGTIGLNDPQMQAIVQTLIRVAPLIAAEVIEACALSVQANGGRRQAIAEEIRREVPKMLGSGE